MYVKDSIEWETCFNSNDRLLIPSTLPKTVNTKKFKNIIEKTNETLLKLHDSPLEQ